MLTKKQLDLLDFISRRVARDGVPPSFDEMKEALKAINTEGRAYIKEVGTELKAKEIEAAKARLSEGMTVRVKYKDEIIEGEIVALRDKTFSIKTEDILNAKGEPSKVSRNYNLVVWDEDATEEVA